MQPVILNARFMKISARLFCTWAFTVKKLQIVFCVFCLSNFAAILDHRLIWAIFQVSGVGRNDFFSKFLLVVKLAFRWGVSFSFSIRKWTGGQIIRSVIIIN